MVRSLIAAALLSGCHRDVPVPVRADPTPPAPPPPSASVAPIARPVHRVKGDIDGRFTLASANVSAGEPIVVELSLTPRSADLPIFVGGDMRNEANYPMRFAVRATDATGRVVCDLVEKPALMSFGGPGSERVIKKGETLVERVVINPACPALGTPGTYRVTIHRRVTTLGMTIKTPTPTSCDVTPIHEDPVPAWVPPACAKLLSDAPSVTSDLELVVRPFDRGAVRAAISKRLHEAAGDEILRHRMQAFVCRFLTCACPKTALVAEADLLAAIGAAPQGAFPAACP